MNNNTEPQKPKSNRKLDYKWVVVGVCFLTTMITLGFCSSPGSLYLDVVPEVIGVSRTAFSLMNTFRFVANAIVNLFFGFLVHKFGTKKLMCAGILCLTGAMALSATATNIYMFYLAGMLLGIGFSWTGTTMMGCVINKWCKENRGTIMGAVLAANGIGGAIAVSWLGTVIEKGGMHYKNAYFIAGTAALIAGVFILIFMREQPKNYNKELPVLHKKKGRGRAWVGIDFAKAKTMKLFYLAAICIFLTGFCLQGVSGIAKAHMKDVGLDPQYIIFVMGFHSIALAGFKFLTGVLYDKCGLRITTSICSLAGAVVMFLLAIITNTPAGMVIAVIYSIFSSLALPLETIMLPIYASDLFGERSYEKILGIFVSINVTGYAVGGPVVNMFHDIPALGGSYRPILFVCCGIMVLVTVLMQLVTAKMDKIKKVIIEENEKAIAEEATVSAD
ncbi:MAG: MFS transporter [Ruminococcaceae bacterium]|nr:MFS transporter [Oscillospiraceae bacterium]